MPPNAVEMIDKLKVAQKELDFTKVSWINKHYIIDFEEKATALIQSIAVFENEELETVLKTSQEFLNEMKPIISDIKAGGKV